MSRNLVTTRGGHPVVFALRPPSNCRKIPRLPWQKTPLTSAENTTVAKNTGCQCNKHPGPSQKTPRNRRRKHRLVTDAKNTKRGHRSKKHRLPSQKTRSPQKSPVVPELCSSDSRTCNPDIPSGCLFPCFFLRKINIETR